MKEGGKAHLTSQRPDRQSCQKYTSKSVTTRRDGGESRMGGETNFAGRGSALTESFKIAKRI
jgi:hypothetical protein